jgi:hypothetical protein
MNRSKYARHRSIKKGKKNQLTAVLAELKRKSTYYKEYAYEPPTGVTRQMEMDWGACEAEIANAPGVANYPRLLATSGSLKVEKIPESLRSGVQRIWVDMLCILTDAFAGGYKIDPNTRGIVAIAYTNEYFDIVISKWGRGDDLKNNHHFYHWHVEAKNAKLKNHPVVYVDDRNADSPDIAYPDGKWTRMEGIMATGLF